MPKLNVKPKAVLFSQKTIVQISSKQYEKSSEKNGEMQLAAMQRQKLCLWKKKRKKKRTS